VKIHAVWKPVAAATLLSMAVLSGCSTNNPAPAAGPPPSTVPLTSSSSSSSRSHPHRVTEQHPDRDGRGAHQHGAIPCPGVRTNAEREAHRGRHRGDRQADHRRRR